MSDESCRCEITGDEARRAPGPPARHESSAGSDRRHQRLPHPTSHGLVANVIDAGERTGYCGRRLAARRAARGGADILPAAFG